MATLESDFKHKPVSEWFLLDWQFILATGRFPVFKPAAVVISTLPLISDVARVVPIATTGFWLFWLASVLSLITFAVTHVFCPDFIRRYEDYSAFDKMGHTHRWIGWLFYLNLKNFSNRDYVVRETLAKGITEPVTELSKTNNSISKVEFSESVSNSDTSVGVPANIHRDLYLPIWIDGSKHVLGLFENDPKLAAKVKELFWIMYSDLAKKNVTARQVIWLLYAAILSLTIVGIGLHVSSPIWSQQPTIQNPILNLIRFVCGAIP